MIGGYQTECEVKRDVTLGYRKLISLFSLLGVGFCSSLAVFSYELLLRMYKGKPRNEQNDPMMMMTSSYTTELNKFIFKWGIGDK